MEDGIFGSSETQSKEVADKLLQGLYEKAKTENNEGVHVREIVDGHIGETVKTL